VFALGEAPPYVMAQLGHTTPSLTLAIYARQMDRRDGEPERLKALVEGREWAPRGTSGDLGSSEPVTPTYGPHTELGSVARILKDRGVIAQLGERLLCNRVAGFTVGPIPQRLSATGDSGFAWIWRDWVRFGRLWAPDCGAQTKKRLRECELQVCRACLRW